MNDLATKLSILVDGRYLGMTGLSKFNSDFDIFSSKQKAAMTQAGMLADQKARDADRARAAVERANAAETRSTEQASKLQLRLTQAQADGQVRSVERYKLAVEQAQRKVAEAADLSARQQIVAQRKVQAAQDATIAKQRAHRKAMLSSAFNGVTNVGVGIGGLAVGAGFEAGKSALSWASFLSQPQAATTLTNKQMRQLQAATFNYAKQSGGDLRDIANAFRYGSDMGLNFALNMKTVKQAMEAALPSGGSVAAMLQAIAAGMVNFPGYRNHPGAVANMILMAAKSGRMNPADLATAIPQTLVIAGHYGNNQLPQALSAVAALTRAGMPIDEANTQIYNMFAHIPTPSAGTRKTLQQIFKKTGVDLRPDFTSAGLRSKGLLGVLDDIRQANLAPDVLKMLLPNMRGYFGALGLTGNQNSSFRQILANVQAAPQTKPNDQNYKRYLGLDTTKLKQAERNLQIMEITVGTKLVPDFTKLLKAATPFFDRVANFVDKHPQLAADWIKWGVAIGGVSLALKTLHPLWSVFISPLAGLVGTLGRVALGIVGIGDAAGTAGIGLEALMPIAAGGGILIGVGLLIGAGVLLYNKWKPFHDLVNAIASTVKKIVTGLGNIIHNATGWGLPGGSSQSSGSTASPTQRGPGSLTTVPGWKLGVPNAPGGYRNPSLGYLNTPFGNYSGATANYASPNDQAMLNSMGVKTHGPIYDTDYSSGGVGRKHNVVLPGTSKAQWTLIKVGVDPNTGGYEVWRAPNGGIVTFLHLSKEQMIGKKTTNPTNFKGAPGVPGPSQWQTLKPGEKVAGGTVVGLSGHPLTTAYGNDPNFWHLCVVTDAKGRQYVTYLTKGQMQTIQRSGGNVKELPKSGGAQMPGSAPGAIKADWGIYQKAASQYGVSAYDLAGMTMQESGGNPNNLGFPGAQTANVQVTGAAKTVRHWWDWLGTPAGKAAMKAQGLNPSSANDRGLAAIAIYNSGPNAPWGKRYYSNASGSVTSSHVSAQTPYARGMQYAAQVAGYADKFAGAGPSAPRHKQITLASLGVGKGKGKHKHGPNLHPDESAIALDEARAAAIASVWTGINPSTLPKTGNHGLNQRAWLQAEDRRNSYLRQIKDHTAHIKLLRHEISKADYEKILRLDKIWQSNVDKAAARKLKPPYSGAAGNVVPVKVTGHCAAEAAANVHRAKTAHHTEKLSLGHEKLEKVSTTGNKHLSSIEQKLDRLHGAIEHLTHALRGTPGTPSGGDARHHGLMPIHAPGV